MTHPVCTSHRTCLHPHCPRHSIRYSPGGHLQWRMHDPSGRYAALLSCSACASAAEGHASVAPLSCAQLRAQRSFVWSPRRWRATLPGGHPLVLSSQHIGTRIVRFRNCWSSLYTNRISCATSTMLVVVLNAFRRSHPSLKSQLMLRTTEDEDD